LLQRNLSRYHPTSPTPHGGGLGACTTNHSSTSWYVNGYRVPHCNVYGLDRPSLLGERLYRVHPEAAPGFRPAAQKRVRQGSAPALTNARLARDRRLLRLLLFVIAFI